MFLETENRAWGEGPLRPFKSQSVRIAEMIFMWVLMPLLGWTLILVPIAAFTSWASVGRFFATVVLTLALVILLAVTLEALIDRPIRRR